MLRAERFELDKAKMQFNSLSKEIGKLKKVREFWSTTCVENHTRE